MLRFGMVKVSFKRFLLFFLSFLLPLLLITVVTIPLVAIYTLGALLGNDWFFPEWGVIVFPLLIAVLIVKGYGKLLGKLSLKPMFPWWAPVAVFLAIILAWAAVDLVLELIQDPSPFINLLF